MSTLIFLPGTIVAVSNQKRSFRNIVPDKNYNRRVFYSKTTSVYLFMQICKLVKLYSSLCITVSSSILRTARIVSSPQLHMCIFFSRQQIIFVFINKIAPMPDPGGTLWINCIQELKIALTFTLYSLFISCNSFKDVETISTALTYRVIVSD